ncbi:hypothetical protein DVS28_a4821 [Euzebya pacifica]|uniref:Uncharacterized protein n=1 Tax=Euzebya pacifica TaxID=1608957 RepID=A0A346Y4T2_9ACTN|nr:helix-turn-helix domain-containing protein [Euzebya pacifica]AXV09479.1 hypothetical protein DVS28_a4821 [Euzebya pacifica]
MDTQPTPIADGATLIDIREAAARTGMTVAYWRDRVRLREIRHYKLGNKIRFDIRDLDAHLLSGMREARHSPGRR